MKHTLPVLTILILLTALNGKAQGNDELLIYKNSSGRSSTLSPLTISGGHIPRRLSYQGLMTTPSGSPVPDGNYDLKFEIYNLPAGGTLRFTETQNGVTVSRGTFSVSLGSVTPLPAIFSESLYVQVTALAGPGIGSPQAFSPRSELTSAPYSLAPWMPTDSGIFYSGGQVGMGTSKPGGNGIPHLRLDLQDEDGGNSDINIGVSGASEAAGNHGWSVLNLSKSRGSIASPLAVQRNDFLGEILFWGHDGSQFRPSSRILSVARGTPSSNNVPSLLAFYTRKQGDTSITKAMTIDTSQNVGIGVSFPAYKLDVSGTVNATAFRGDGSQLTNLPSGSSQWTTSGSNIYYNPGNVGIGTTTPRSALEVLTNQSFSVFNLASTATLGYGTVGLGFNLVRTGADSWTANQDGFNNGGEIIYGSAVNGLNFVTVPSTGAVNQSYTDSEIAAHIRMKIDQAGNVGIGTTSPTHLLHLTRSANDNLTGMFVQNDNAGGSAQSRIDFGPDWSTRFGSLIYDNTLNRVNLGGGSGATGGMIIDGGAPSAPIAFQTNGAERMRINGSGNVGIGISSPSEKLEVAGNIKIGNTTIHSGTGSPEGTVTGNVGDLYLRTDGGAGTTMYVKESGAATNTGWVGK
jgi:hypothetical protein